MLRWVCGFLSQCRAWSKCLNSEWGRESPTHWLTCIRDAVGLRDPWGQDTDSLDRDVQGFLFTTGRGRGIEGQNAWVRFKSSEGDNLEEE